MEHHDLMEQFAKEPTMRIVARRGPPPGRTRFPPASSLLADTPAKPKAPGLGDPGQLTAIAVETGRLKDGVVTISGRDAGQQIVVTGQYDSGQPAICRRKATYEVTPGRHRERRYHGADHADCRRRSDDSCRRRCRASTAT